jgi:hypothetical protein
MGVQSNWMFRFCENKTRKDDVFHCSLVVLVLSEGRFSWFPPQLVD